MIQSMYQKMVEYLKKQGGYVSYKAMYSQLTYGGGSCVKAFNRAWQDLKASGRIELGINDTLRINQ
jgi:hypothetical protein